MKRSVQLVIILFATVLLAAVCSHALASWVKVRTTAVQAFVVGQAHGKPPAYMAGSSLAGYGLSWEQITAQLGVEMHTWGIAGGSPYEWEQFQPNAPDVDTSFIVVSAYDLNEGIICDYRAELVPIGHTIATLRAIHANWDYTKRALTRYPTAWLRTLFPTLGRSKGVMGDLRAKIQKLIKPSAPVAEGEAGPRLDFGKEAVVDEYKLQKVSDWSPAEILRKTSAMQAGIQGDESFAGPKMLALDHMLHYADQRGRTVVVVLPVSPTYAKEFFPPDSVRNFEASLARLQSAVPRAEWIRLDQLPSLVADANFCDLVHMNYFGQKIATGALLARLGTTTARP